MSDWQKEAMKTEGCWCKSCDQLRAENERLVLAIADHVTVRAEQRQEIERLAGDVMFWREKYAEAEAELAEAKKGVELIAACHAFINSPITVESCKRFNEAFEAMKGK